jgi:hypothetical protein
VDPWMSWRVFLVVVVAWEGDSDLGERVRHQHA